MKRIAIFGVGLIGGSLGMALRKKSGYRVTGIGRDARKLARARRLGALDSFTIDAAAGVRDADIVVFGMPVDRIAYSVRKVLPYLKPGAILTDVGSVKGPIVRDIERILKRNAAVTFIGGHPMAGSEKTGAHNGDVHLFEGATVVLVPPRKNRKSLEVIRAMWRATGARIIEMPAKEHDRLVACSSHLPHVLAFSLAAVAGKKMLRSGNLKRLVAGSFQDMTRVAESSPSDWAAICSMNKKEIDIALARYLQQLRRMKACLGNKAGLARAFSSAGTARRKIVPNG